MDDSPVRDQRLERKVRGARGVGLYQDVGLYKDYPPEFNFSFD